MTAVPQRATSDGGSYDATSAAQGVGSGVAGVPDAQSDAALAAPRPDSAVALTGPAACAASGGQCEVRGCKFENSEACGPGEVCCLDNMICAADATAPIIQASDYDQSCAGDSECVEVQVGDACSCDFSCALSPAAINMSALPQYKADVAKVPRLICGCPPPPPPCADETYPGPGPHCVGGLCQITPCPE